MPYGSQGCIPNDVLIVDDSEECRDVLTTLLRRRGVQTLEASEAKTGLQLLKRHQPRVVVLDLDAPSADEETIRSEYCDSSHTGQTALVVLGRLRESQPSSEQTRVISKPYHYEPLIRTIEQLLGK